MPKEHDDLIKKYMADHGQFCPVCNSNDLQADRVEIDADTAVQAIGCGNCESTWNDLYTLNAIERLTIASCGEK